MEDTTFNLQSSGLVRTGAVHRNLSPAALIEHAVRRGEGILSSMGAFAAFTGARTGRSPKDKYIVRTPSIETDINWGSVNQPIDPAVFQRLKDLLIAYYQNRELFVFDGHACAEAKHRLNLRVITEKAWHNLFARCMFIRPKDGDFSNFTPDWTIYHAPNFHALGQADGVNSEVAVLINFEDRVVIAAGPHYAGEIKKSIFTILNYLLPKKGVLSMHCSANKGTSGDVALFFGLSGTGKTTLSADPDRQLIGDDEHGWGDEGVFNIEGGCYAKTIKLSLESEPQIWNAIRFGCVLENVPIDPVTRVPDFNSTVTTENTRAAYPIDFIPNAELSGVGGHPTNIFFLTCDAFGVLPPISKLTPDQAMQQFLCGYTAKVAGTEAGVTEPTTTFSTCFGAPFMPMRPKVYGNMLKERMQRFNVPVWLVNTGWSGGGVTTGGKRMKLAWTRALLKAAMTGTLNAGTFVQDPVFGLSVPTSCPDVPSEVLLPRNTWQDKAAYDTKANQLKAMFEDEYKKYV